MYLLVEKVIGVSMGQRDGDADWVERGISKP